jgi:hypothetical protein
MRKGQKILIGLLLVVVFAGCNAGVPEESKAGAAPATQGESQLKNLVAQKASLVAELSNHFCKWVFENNVVAEAIRQRTGISKSMPEAHIKSLARLPLDMLCGALEGKEDTVEGCVECYRTATINEITSAIDELRLALLDAEAELASLKSEGSNGAAKPAGNSPFFHSVSWKQVRAEHEIERLNEEIKEKIEECNEVRNDAALNCSLEFWKKLLDAHDKETLRASTKHFLMQLMSAGPTLGEDQKDAAKKNVEEGVDKLFHEFGDKVASLMAVVKQIRVLSEA